VKTATLILCAAAWTAAAAELPSQAEAPRKTAIGEIDNLPWDRFYNYPDLVELARAIQRRWPKYVRIEEIGRSFQGRAILALTVHDPETGRAEDKPAMYVDGNIHGNEIQGAEAALYTAWYLLKHRKNAPKLRKIFERCTLYVLPTINPDGRAFWFDEANTTHSSRGGQIPTDNDGDGRYDEDGPNDLDGDGNLCRMRKRTPGEGNYKIDPKDPRRMIPCKPGEKGDWILLGIEGIDDDGDGRINEDGPGGYDPNRDWGSDWQPSWLQWGARPLPFGLPESRAVRDFLLRHPNIAGVQSFHNFGGMILRGPGDKNLPYPGPDRAVYDAIGKKGESLLPFYRYMVLWRDLYGVHGGEIDWTYLGLGILSFTNELWTWERWKQSEGKVDRKTLDEYEDRLAFGAHFVPWKEFDHPTYGRIEIGGSTKDSGRIPPGFLIREMLHRNASFVLYHMEELPEVVCTGKKVEQADENLFYVTVTLRNERLIPTRTAQAAAKRIGRPDVLEVRADGCRVLAAGEVRDPFRPAATKLFPPRFDPGRIPIERGLGSHGKLEIRYLVEGTGRLRFHYRGEKIRDLAFEVRIGH